MTSFTTPKQYSEEITVTIEPRFAKQVVEFLVNGNYSFHLALNYPSQKEITAPEQPTSTPSSEITIDTPEQLWEKLPQYIVNTIKRKKNITAEDVAARLQLSPYTFKSRFSTYFGKPFYQYYLEKRMEYAAELLKHGYKGTHVAEKVGYGAKSAIKFNKMFQKHFGMTPKKYQTEHKK